VIIVEPAIVSISRHDKTVVTSLTYLAGVRPKRLRLSFLQDALHLGSASL
jgi:hypothetical protein